MPPKAGKKRSRDSTGTATTTPASPAAGVAAAAAAAPSSAPPAHRQPRSSSATSQEEDGGSGGEGGGETSRATKRSRQSDSAEPITDSGNGEEDVDMGDVGEVAGQTGANGGEQGAAAAAGVTAATAGAVAKKGSGRRKSASAAPANGQVRVLPALSSILPVSGDNVFLRDGSRTISVRGVWLDVAPTFPRP